MTPLKIISLFFTLMMSGCGNVDASAVTQTDATNTAKNNTDTKDSKLNLAPEIKAKLYAKSLPIITRNASPYMTAKLEERHASLLVMCTERLEIGFEIYDGEFRTKSGVAVPTDNFGFRFWNDGKPQIYFDDNFVDIDSKYKKIKKQADNDFDAKLIASTNSRARIFIANLKTARTLQIKHENIGPVFELGNIKDEIETLEAQCAPKDSQK